MKIGIYSGSFDCLHNGHMWVIEQGSKLFDEFYVVIGTHYGKEHFFTKAERLKILTECIDLPNVKVDFMDEKNSIVAYSKRFDNPILLRGIRNPKDMMYEAGICYQIRRFSDIPTIFLVPPPELTNISSSNIKKDCENGDWDIVREKVPLPSFTMLVKYYSWIVCKPEVASIFDTTTAGLCPRDIKLTSQSGHKMELTDDFDDMKCNFNKLVNNGFIDFPETVTSDQVRKMLDPFQFDVVSSNNFHLKQIKIDNVKSLGERHLYRSQSLGPIIVDYNDVIGDDTELGELGPFIVIEGKHRLLDAKEAGEETILAYVGEKAIENGL